MENGKRKMEREIRKNGNKGMKIEKQKKKWKLGF